MTNNIPWAIVTGASSGIGREMAKILAQKGMNLVIIARTSELLVTLKTDLESFGVQSCVICSDLTKVSAINDILQVLEEKDINPYVLINNAGCGLFGTFAQQNSQEISNMLTLNIQALTLLTHAIIPKIPPGGYIMNVSSIICFQATPYYAAYAASKSYVDAFSQALQYELSPNIHVSTLYPGMTDTRFFETSHQVIKPWLKSLMMKSAPFVAKKAITGMLNNKKTMTPGMINKISSNLGYYMPNWITTKLMAFLFKNR
ncbi:SDR family NAD(P)-dependent oxidoreductase [Candidatus Synchoanobacter obligatus]|uniref:NADP-dependent 3-hydroxy acid dehydrogenase YdfG n=1 Tax=Candidatus Synchoanobacter obligatus TaxID=2919597 RepID=A0ABT1L7E2_9GAMM|nr:SDR family NAD(P)-dependent oxidoreductase [Candidatus Synchoanobacter obligatus]MCP8352653.1 SDR family NAD(P)-dependent oxidoreductase [Candidatus Synchoanobacter obligatus]